MKWLLQNDVTASGEPIKIAGIRERPFDAQKFLINLISPSLWLVILFCKS